ncbi:MAG: glycosyltransferase family 2 protein, partial [Bacteroidota bacterium]
MDKKLIMISLSVVIITKNEAHNIVRCLEAVRTIADEIVIVDSGSTDETAALCQLYQARFISHPFQDYMQQKNYATQQASSPYILSLDADEVVSTALLNAIQAAKQNWQYDVYVLQRLNNYCGQWIRHGGWYPDRKIRLFDRRKAAWGAGAVHERLLPQPDATIGTLTGDLLHYSYSSIAEHVARNNRYTTQIATFAFQQG